MTQKENGRVPFSLRECKDRKKGLGITMAARNIFWVRLLAQSSQLYAMPFAFREMPSSRTPTGVVLIMGK